MISSRFQNSKSVKLPVVCIKPTLGLGASYVNGIPTSLLAYARWLDSAIGVCIVETFRLVYYASASAWTGESGRTGINLHLTIDRLLTPNTYDFTLTLRNGLTPIDDDSWHDLYVEPGPPFQSGHLTHVYTKDVDLNEIQVTD